MVKFFFVDDVSYRCGYDLVSSIPTPIDKINYMAMTMSCRNVQNAQSILRQDIVIEQFLAISAFLVAKFY